jgi:hypothetical protein
MAKAKKKSAKKKSVKSSQRPIKFLKAMAAKMEKNIPKLRALIAKRGG